MQIEDRLRPEHVLSSSRPTTSTATSVPGDPTSADPYGKNTYWGGKLIYKAADGNVYVATVPTHGFNPAPELR